MARTLSLLSLVALLSVVQYCEAQSPHTLLRNSDAANAQRALEIMKVDPSWINKQDTDQQTPLHVAVSYNHQDVVEWLLANGADFNAQAYNGFTPLHMTRNPEIVKQILEKKPDLTLESVGGTPLQRALDDLRHCSEFSSRSGAAKQEVESLRSIVEMYVEHLGDKIDIISAIRLGNLDMVEKITAADPTAARGQGHGPNPLREAADWGQLEICKFLVDKHKVDVNDFKGGNGYPITKSALKHPDIVQYLIEQNADLETRITWRALRTGVWIVGDDATILHYAASDGVPETVKILLDAGVDPFATARDSIDQEDKQTALEVAAFFGKTDNVNTILDHPKFKEVDPELRRETLDRSLAIGSFSSWLASESLDRSELLKVLISHGANPNTTLDGKTPLQIAAADVHPNHEEQNKSIRKMVTVLRKHGAEIDVFSAVAIGDFDLLEKLLKEHPKTVDSYSFEGYPALHMAIEMNYPKAVKLLLEAGGDVEIKNKSELTGAKGGTPLLCVAFWGHDEIAALLIKAGGDVNATTEKLVTPLHEAVRLGNVGVAKLLLKNGANKLAKDHLGKTPLDWASDPMSAQEFEKLFSEFEDLQSEK